MRPTVLTLPFPVNQMLRSGPAAIPCGSTWAGSWNDTIDGLRPLARDAAAQARPATRAAPTTSTASRRPRSMAGRVGDPSLEGVTSRTVLHTGYERATSG